MNFPLYISKRYLFAKKSHNAINIISAISVVGVTIGTAALIIVLSVFNGFDDLIKSLYNSFDPDIKITSVEGKTFVPNANQLKQLSNLSGVAVWSEVIEENVLLKYGEKQYIATMKGVDSRYNKVNGIDSMIVEGDYKLRDKNEWLAVIGQGVSYYLQTGLKFITPIEVFLPRKNAYQTINPQNAFNHKIIYPSGVFSVEQEIDAKYMIVPIEFARELTEDTSAISAIEIKLTDDAQKEKVQKNIQKIFGRQFFVKDRFQQKAIFYRIMKYEKWAIFMILSFILLIASFNVIGSLSVLIIEKKRDIGILHSMGASKKLLERIFLYEGLMITFFGCLIGLILGLIVCLVQIVFEPLKLQGSGSFIIDAYPVSIHGIDILFILVTVMLIGYAASHYPVKLIIRRYLPENSFRN